MQFKDTGDELLDKWEAELAAGRTPDYSEAFDQEQLERLKNLREKGSSKFAGLTRTMKDVVESVDQTAHSEGLQSTRSRSRFSTFGDGSE